MSSISIAKNGKNQKQVQTLNELSKRKVVEHNDLISSVAKMDKTPLKIFELAVSCIDTDNPPKDNTIFLSKQELFTFFDVSDNDKHSRFKGAITTLHQQSVFEIREMNEYKNKFEYQVISPLEKTTWNDYNDIIEITFTKSIMPYLIDLKKNFTQYALSDLVDLNSKYSIILYKWLSMQYNQYEHYTIKGGRRADQVEAYRDPSITVKELRVLTDTLKEYQHFPHFEAWVLKKPLEEITEHTHFNVSYAKIKKGRNIDSIQFFITKKSVAKNENYKKEQQDEAYLVGKANKEQEQQKLFAEAMQSEYTTILVENMLIGFRDFRNIELMANLQCQVYPFYDQLKEQKGITQVEKHLSYVADKQEDYSKRNIVKYLQTAIKQYLSI